MNKFKSYLLMGASIALMSCGGGSNSSGGGTVSPPPPPPPPAVDSTSPVITVSPTSFTVDSGQTFSVTVSASDNVGVTTGPDISCTNGGAFANNVFTAPTVTVETQSVCTVTASDAAGNSASETFTATIREPDTTSPVISLSPMSFTLRSGETQAVSVSATDDRAVTAGPDVACTNGGTFASGVFTAPVVTADTIVVCTVSAEDAAGNAASETFTATVLVPTSFTTSGTASKGLLLEADIFVYDSPNGLVSDALIPANAISNGQSSAADGSFTLTVDTTERTLSDYIILQAIITGGNMVCDAVLGCGVGINFGDSFSIDSSADPVTLLAIIPTPNDEEAANANINIFTHLQSELALARSKLVSTTTLRAQDISDSQTQVSSLFGLNDADFTNLDFVDISSATFSTTDSNVVEAALIAGGVLGSAFESTGNAFASLTTFVENFLIANGEVIGREVTDNSELISLQDIFQNAALIKNVNNSMDQAFMFALSEVEFLESEINRAQGDSLTSGGGLSFGNNFPPQFVTGIDYTISVNSTSFIQILVGDIDFDPLTFSLDASGDGAFFDLTEDGKLTIASALDVGNPSDANEDNIYELIISVNDTKDTVVQRIPVTVTDDSADGFALTGQASKGLMKGGDIEVYNESLDLVAMGTSSSEDGRFTIDVSDNAFIFDHIRVVADFTDITMICDAPRGCGDSADFGDDYLIPDDQNGTIEAILLPPEGGSTTEVHINLFTQLVSFNVGQDIEPPNPTNLATSRETVGDFFGLAPQDFSTLDYVDVTDPNVAPTDLQSTLAALLQAGLFGATFEDSDRLENALINFYFSFTAGNIPDDDEGDPERISRIDYLTHASEIRGVNPSTNPIFIQALDIIDAERAILTGG